MDSPMTKARFLETLQAERSAWEALLDEVGEERVSEPGAAGDWSVKDIIAHVTAYERGLVEWLEAASRGEAVTFDLLDHPDLDYRNAVIYAENRDRPLEEVLRASEAVFRRLLARVEALPEEDLLDPGRTAWFVEPRWKQRRALWECIADDSYRHYHQHVPGIRGWLDDKEKRDEHDSANDHR